MNNIPIETSDKFQVYIIQGILTDPSIFVRTRTILNLDYFDNTPLHSNKTCINYFHEFYNRYNNLPDISLINLSLKDKNPQEDGYVQIQNWNKIDDSERLIKEIETYCRHRACIKAAMEVYNKIEKHDTTNVVDTLQSAVMLKLPSNFGTPVYSNGQTLYDELKELHSTQYELKTGWNELDIALSGGFGYGEIEVFCAASGGGKSVALANLGLNYSLQGMNVMYFSLELNEILTKKRIISMITGYPLRTMKGNEAEVAEVYNEKMEEIGWDKIGEYNIMQIPNGSNTMDIEAIINEYEIKNNKIINVIIVDYADLMSPMQKVSRENIHLAEKFIYEELRGLATRRTAEGKKCVVLTASQLNKGALNTDIGQIEQDSLSGSVGKNYTADNVISLQSTPAMKEKGLMKFKFLKSRNSSYTKDIELSYNIDTLRIDNTDISKYGNNVLDNRLIQNDMIVKETNNNGFTNQILEVTTGKL